MLRFPGENNDFAFVPRSHTTWGLRGDPGIKIHNIACFGGNRNGLEKGAILKWYGSSVDIEDQFGWTSF